MMQLEFQLLGCLMSAHDKFLSLVLSTCIFIIFAPSAAPAAVIYSTGFENGLPIGSADAPTENGYCRSGFGGGTNRLPDYRGCVSVVPTSSINAGSGSFVAWADPNQSDEGDPVSGSTFHLLPSVSLVDGWHGRYELSFNGYGIVELIFVDEIWSFTFGVDDIDGLASKYVIEIDFDQRIEQFGSISADPASLYLCSPEFFGVEGCGFHNWHFAIQNGGWIDDIELNYLGLGQGSTAVPEPGTLGLILTGLIVAGTLNLLTSVTNRLRF
ncbi:MAG: PEP-CTERM sorting domain-containing protein [Pyrinomonadaceae bacterium]|nr:PEP-CTERM sorting domain-containing protein [Pyrinomonadaceae bacterium]